LAGGLVAASVVDSNQLSWQKIGTGIITGVAVAVTTSVLLDWINGKGVWANSGHIFHRWSKRAEPVKKSVFVAPSPTGS
jgi:type IV secretory pathway TrbD component